MKIHSSCEIEDFVETHLCKLCVILPDRAYYELCVLIKDIGRRLPLQLQCSYHGLQGDFIQSVRGNYIVVVSYPFFLIIILVRATHRRETLYLTDKNPLQV